MELLQISIEAARVNAKMTVDEAADGLNVTRQTLRKWEKGESCPRLDVVRRMSELYKIPIDNLYLSGD